MEVRRHDIVLVGGGAAGLRAAIAVAEAAPDLSVAMVSKLYPMRSHTVSAEGGAAGVVGPDDSLDLHAYDTLKGSDFLHWGKRIIYIGSEFISLQGKIAPGPDYKLYLSPQFVEDEAEFNQIKSKMVRVGDVKTFENFIVPVPSHIDPKSYSAAIVWCESFGEFITAATYQ